MTGRNLTSLAGGQEVTIEHTARRRAGGIKQLKSLGGRTFSSGGRKIKFVHFSLGLHSFKRWTKRMRKFIRLCILEPSISLTVQLGKSYHLFGLT